MNRRDLLRQTGLAALARSPPHRPQRWLTAADAPKKKILMFTRSQGFQHDVVHRKGGKLSLAEQIVTDLGAKHGFEVVCEKDGRVFLVEGLPQVRRLPLRDAGRPDQQRSAGRQPPMPAEGKKALLDAVAARQGLRRLPLRQRHLPLARRPRDENQERDKLDPYIAMLGGEFIRHGSQQKAWHARRRPQVPRPRRTSRTSS